VAAVGEEVVEGVSIAKDQSNPAVADTWNQVFTGHVNKLNQLRDKHKLTSAKIYADYSSLDITNVTAGARGTLTNRGLKTNETLLGGQSIASEVGTKEQRVAVILDIKKHDWIFTTQPGALRRVIMNLFGTFP